MSNSNNLSIILYRGEENQDYGNEKFYIYSQKISTQDEKELEKNFIHCYICLEPINGMFVVTCNHKMDASICLNCCSKYDNTKCPICREMKLIPFSVYPFIVDEIVLKKNNKYSEGNHPLNQILKSINQKKSGESEIKKLTIEKKQLEKKLFDLQNEFQDLKKNFVMKEKDYEYLVEELQTKCANISSKFDELEIKNIELESKLSYKTEKWKKKIEKMENILLFFGQEIRFSKINKKKELDSLFELFEMCESMKSMKEGLDKLYKK